MDFHLDSEEIKDLRISKLQGICSLILLEGQVEAASLLVRVAITRELKGYGEMCFVDAHSCFIINSNKF